MAPVEAEREKDRGHRRKRKGGPRRGEGLLEHGYEILNVDLAAPAERKCPFIKADLTRSGEVFEVLRGFDAVVHLAAIPAPGFSRRRRHSAPTWRAPSTCSPPPPSGCSVSSGRPVRPPSASRSTGEAGVCAHRRAHPLYPESSYALSKVLWEEMARQYTQVRPSLLSACVSPTSWSRRTTPSSPVLERRPAAQVEPVGVCRCARRGAGLPLALERPGGASDSSSAAADTVMDRPSRDLMEEVYPDVPSEGAGKARDPLSIDRARSLRGYSPRWSWRTQR